jgi:D-alanyl-D-alanine carboxypeptidase/D-alanyl-D-alanine-endopeptidase (penicillin-binding protein 4)
MKKYFLLTTSLVLLVFWPIQAQEIAAAGRETTAPERFNTISETTYLDQLARKGFNLESQGFYIESLDGSMIFADHHSDVAFNPASVIKIATSFAALDRLGPDYHFETALYADGEINKTSHTLKGNLILQSTGDPFLTAADVSKMIRGAIQAGITRVTGDLVFTGPFTYATYWTTTEAIKHFQTTLRAQGIRINGSVEQGSARGNRLDASWLTSPTLHEILSFQNDHSNNATAERIGEAIGGPAAVEDFLVHTVGLPAADVHVGRSSGLDYNRITPRGTVQMLRKLVQWLDVRHMSPESVMPIAGIDDGTLKRRFTSVDYRGAIIGKTGTLPGTDGGVSTLAGIAYTRDRGPLLFAIFNTHGPVNTYRRMQDTLLEDLILEFGGAPAMNGSTRRTAN